MTLPMIAPAIAQKRELLLGLCLGNMPMIRATEAPAGLPSPEKERAPQRELRRPGRSKRYGGAHSVKRKPHAQASRVHKPMSGRERMRRMPHSPGAIPLTQPISQRITDTAQLLDMLGRGECRFQRRDLCAIAAALRDNAQSVQRMETRMGEGRAA